MASSRSGTMALIAAWKASSRELSAGFGVVFGFDAEDCGRGWSGGLALLGGSFDLGSWSGFLGSFDSVESTVSSHGFVFAAFICVCCFGIEGSL